MDEVGQSGSELDGKLALHIRKLKQGDRASI
jgi:hypothetical protein